MSIAYYGLSDIYGNIADAHAVREADEEAGIHNWHTTPGHLMLTRLARIIHECRHEAFETEARRGFSQVRPT
jgi:hypothetical protein